MRASEQAKLKLLTVKLACLSAAISDNLLTKRIVGDGALKSFLVH